MMKGIAMVAFGALVASINSGCVYSYHDLEMASCSAGWPQSVTVAADEGGCVDGLGALHTWRRTLFYPRYFTFFHLRDGLHPAWMLEAVCRLPTILFEVPFNSINRGEKRVELRLPDMGPTSVAGAAMPVMLSKDEVDALTRNEKLKGFAVQPRSDVGYRFGDGIYLIDTDVHQQYISLFGVPFSSPEAVVWRIDPITGERDVLVSFDTGKFIIENPPRKVESRYE